MQKNGNMDKGVGGQVVKLDPVVMQEPREEIRTRESKYPFKIRSKSYDLARIFIRMVFTKA